MVNELLTYCPNKNDGCSYQGQRQLLITHLKEECLFTKLACCNEECKEIIFKKDLSEHMENCKARMVKCENCEAKVQLSTLEVNFFKMVIIILIFCAPFFLWLFIYFR
jgi:hypothetical protein